MKPIIVFNFIEDYQFELESEFIINIPYSQYNEITKVVNSIRQELFVIGKTPPDLEQDCALVICNNKELSKEEEKILDEFKSKFFRDIKTVIYFRFEENISGGKEDIQSIIFDKVDQVNFILSNYNEDNLALPNPLNDKYSIVKNFIEYLHENYSNFSQILQNKDKYLFNGVLGSAKQFIDKDKLNKYARSILLTKTYSKYITKLEDKTADKIIIQQLKTLKNNNVIIDESYADNKEKENRNIVSQFRFIFNKCSDFLKQTNVADIENGDDLYTNSLNINTELFNDYADNSKIRKKINTYIQKVKGIRKKHDKVEVERLTADVYKGFKDIVSSYENTTLINIESDINEEYNQRVINFINFKNQFIDNCVSDYFKNNNSQTSVLENLLAHLDLIISGKSDYIQTASTASGFKNYCLEAIQEKQLSKKKDPISLEGQVIALKNNLNSELENLQKRLEYTDKELIQAIDNYNTISLHYSQFKSEPNSRSWLPFRWLPLSNLSILVLGLSIVFLGIFFIAWQITPEILTTYKWYWGFPVILITSVLVLRDLYYFNRAKKRLKQIIELKTNYFIKSKNNISYIFEGLIECIKNVLLNKLIKKYINIVSTERYQILQLRKYFIYHYYSSFNDIKSLSEREESEFRKNLLDNNTIIEFFEKEIGKLNVTEYNTDSTLRYLNEFKKESKISLNENISTLNYVKKESILDINPEAVVSLTEEDQENADKYQYHEIENANLFCKSKNGVIAEIDPEDIHQGKVGDCYFLATLSAIAQINPSYIKETVSISENNEFYIVRFFDNDANEVFVETDGKLYTSDGDSSLLYARFNPKQIDDRKIWPAIVEKAWAKINKGSYDAIIGSNGFNRTYQDYGMALSGYNIETKKVESVKTFNDFKNFLLEIGFFENKAVVTLGSLPKTQWTSGTDKDLVEFHAYSLMSVNSDGTINIRNPWGEKHFIKKDFAFLKNNFRNIYFFKIDSRNNIFLKDKLDITKMIHGIYSDLKDIYDRSDIYKDIQSMNFYNFISNREKCDLSFLFIKDNSKLLMTKNKYSVDTPIYKLLLPEGDQERLVQNLEDKFKKGMSIIEKEGIIKTSKSELSLIKFSFFK